MATAPETPRPTSKGMIVRALLHRPAKWSKAGMGTGSFPGMMSVSGNMAAGAHSPVQLAGKAVKAQLLPQTNARPRPGQRDVL